MSIQTAREVAGKVKVHIEVNSSVNYVTPVLLIRLAKFDYTRLK